MLKFHDILRASEVEVRFFAFWMFVEKRENWVTFDRERMFFGGETFFVFRQGGKLGKIW